jgi:hypothetical protein
VRYCVWQMWASPGGVLYPVKPVEGQQKLELVAAQTSAQKLNKLPSEQMQAFKASEASSPYHYTRPRPSRCYDVVRCGKCECD